MQKNKRTASSAAGSQGTKPPLPAASVSKPVSFLIIEDHAIVADFVARIAEETFKQVRVQSTRHGLEGVDICRTGQPDIVLLDLELPDTDGFELITKIHEVSPESRILIFSSHTEAYILHRLQKANVDGFVDKNEQSLETLVEALRCVWARRKFMSPSIEDAVNRLNNDPLSFSKLLSEREQELLRLFGQGLSDAKIAQTIGLKEVTVRNHRRNIMSRLDIHSTPELIRYALENGFTRLRPKRGSQS